MYLIAICVDGDHICLRIMLDPLLSNQQWPTSLWRAQSRRQTQNWTQGEPRTAWQFFVWKLPKCTFSITGWSLFASQWLSMPSIEETFTLDHFWETSTKQAIKVKKYFSFVQKRNWAILRNQSISYVYLKSPGKSDIVSNIFVSPQIIMCQ